ncbi:MAG: single-stranded DNA-binding protein [Patescibacteria group bacterium]
MRSVNKVILIGNLTRDPEVKQTQSGHSVVTFGMATNREWMTRDNRKDQSTEFHEVVAWAKLGDICAKYLRKGKLVYVEGYLKTRSWAAPDGTKRFRTEIVVQDMIMLEKRGKDDAVDTFEEKDMLEAAPQYDEGAARSSPGENVFEG